MGSKLGVIRAAPGLRVRWGDDQDRVLEPDLHLVAETLDDKMEAQGS